MFLWRQQIPGATDRGDAERTAGPDDAAEPVFSVDWGFTHSALDEGLSTGPYLGLNLADHVGDDDGAVRANRALLAQRLGVDPADLVVLRQVHGADVVVADGPWPGLPPEADAVVTRQPDLPLLVLVADCTPLLLADPVAGVIGAVHAGRPGLLAGIVPAAVHAMRDLGAEDIVAAVGPSVCGRCYEVPEPMRADAAARIPVSATVSWTGTPAIDIAAGAVAQLASEGIPMTWIPGCTREDPRLYSYRRNERTGRFAGVVRLRRDPAHPHT